MGSISPSYRRIPLFAGTLATVVALVLPTLHTLSHWIPLAHSILDEEPLVDYAAFTESSHHHDGDCPTCELTAALRAVSDTSQDWEPALRESKLIRVGVSLSDSSPSFSTYPRGPPLAGA